MTEEKKNELVPIEIKLFGVSFGIPKRIGVQTALNYWSLVTVQFNTKNHLVRIWEAALDCDLLKDWQCERFPDPKIPLDDVPEEDELFVAQLIMAVAGQVQGYMASTRSVEKN